DDDDVLALHSGPRRDRERGCNGGARRDPARNAFQTGKVTGRIKRFLIPDGHHLVDDRAIENGRNEIRADALDLGGPRPPARQNGRTLGLARHDPERRPPWLQHLAHPRNGPSGAYTGNKNVDLAIRVVPDFLCGRAAMDFRIGRVDELTWYDRAFD